MTYKKDIYHFAIDTQTLLFLLKMYNYKTTEYMPLWYIM